MRSALWPERISGGSNSGSGRVPAALNRVVGIKPTLGLVPTTGMADAYRPFDTITMFARAVATASSAAAIMFGYDGRDGLCRVPPLDVRLAVPASPGLEILLEEDLQSLSQEARTSWDFALARWAGVAELRPLSIATLLQSARLV